MSEERHGRLSEILDRALDLEGAERRDYLDGLRGEDPELVAEVEGLLALEEDLDTAFLAGGAVEASEVSTFGGSLPGGEEPEEDMPERIGPYRLIGVLGTGGMGKVYLAHQTEPLDRHVALKVARGSFRSASARARFELERQVLAQLEHPFIGRILDAGTTETGRPFFALEVVEGEPITAYCDRVSLPVEGRLRLMIDVCRGVEHAHRKEVIHRDLKPSNILVGEVDGRPVPKIIDFGVARSLTGPLAEIVPEERKILVGTPAFMSPEALQDAPSVDTRTDVYSLGVLLYLLLAGRRPFLADSVFELVSRVTTEDPPRPSRRLSAELDRETVLQIADRRGTRPPELRRRLRGDLDWILTRAVARNRQDRYGSAADLGDDLERYLSDLPVRARPWTPAYLARRWLRRNRWRALVATVAAVAVIGLLWLDAHARQRTEILTRAGEELAREVEGVEWRLRVAHLLPAHDLTPELRSIRDDMNRLRRRIPELYRGHEGAAQYALGRGALSLGDLEPARQHLERAWELGERDPEQALALGDVLGRLYEERLLRIGRIPDAEVREKERELAKVRLRDPALELLERAAADLALPELTAARIAFYRRDFDEALAKARSAVAARPSLFEARLLEGEILLERADDAEDSELRNELFDDAEAAVLAAVEVARSSPQAHLRLCRLRSVRLSRSVRYGWGNVDELHRRAREACEATRRILPGMGAALIQEGIVWNDLADVQLWDRQEDPRPSLAEARALLDRVPPSSPEAAEALGQKAIGERLRAYYLEFQGQDPRPALEEAAKYLERALEVEPGRYDWSTLLGNVLLSSAGYGARRGEDPTAALGQAEAVLEQAMAIRPERIQAPTYLAQALLRRAEDAISHGRGDPTSDLKRARTLLEGVMDRDPRRASVLSTLTAVLLMEGVWELQAGGGDPRPALGRAKELADRMLELHPDAPFPPLIQGQALDKTARWQALQGLDPSPTADEARKRYAVGMARVPDLPGPYLEVAGLYLAEARYLQTVGKPFLDQAERLIELASRAREIDPARTDALVRRGQGEILRAEALFEAGSRVFERPRGVLREALDEQPDNARAHLALASLVWAEARLGIEDADIDQGLAAARRARELHPFLVEALAVEGALLTLQEGTREEGRAKIAEAVEKNGHLAWTWGSVRQGDPDR